MITYNYKVNMTPGGIPPRCKLGQYDDDWSIVFSLYTDYGTLSIESGTTAKIRGTKRDGLGYSANATINISAATVTVAGDKQITAISGDNVFELVLLKGTKELSTANIIFAVEPAAMDAGTLVSDSQVQEILDMSADVIAASNNVNTLRGNFAPTYSSSSGTTYQVGDYVMHDNQLYRCTTAITTAEAWTPAHWTAVSLGPAVSDLKSDLQSDLAEVLSGTVDSPITANDKTQAGITFTVTSTTITVNGTATGNALIDPFTFTPKRTGKYFLAGAPSGGGTSTFVLYVGNTSYIDTGDGVICTLNAGTEYLIRIVVYNGYTANNLVFTPKLTYIDAVSFYTDRINGVSKHLSIDNFDLEFGSWQQSGPEQSLSKTRARTPVFKASGPITVSLADYDGYRFSVVQYPIQAGVKYLDSGWKTSDYTVDIDDLHSFAINLSKNDNAKINDLNEFNVSINSDDGIHWHLVTEDKFEVCNDSVDELAAELAEFFSGEIYIPITANDKTQAGITFKTTSTTITVNGTATGNAFIDPFTFTPKRTGKYFLAGAPSGGGASTFVLYVGNTSYIDTGDGVICTLNAGAEYLIRIVVYNGYTANNLVFTPKLTYKDAASFCTDKMNWKRPPQYYYDHLFIKTIGQGVQTSDIVIPSESLANVNSSFRLGFKMIEANVKALNDGNYLVCHGGGNVQSSWFGFQFVHVDGTTNISTIPFSDVSLDWVKANVRYKAKYAKYATAPYTLQEFLHECKKYNMTALIQCIDANVARIADEILGKNQWIGYNATRSMTNGPIMRYKSHDNLSAILNECETTGHPCMYGMANPTDFTLEELDEIIKAVHQRGYLIGYVGAFLNERYNQYYKQLGFDFSASGWNVNEFENGNVCNLYGDVSFNDFTTTGTVVENSIRLETGDTVIPANTFNDVFLGKGQLNIAFDGEIVVDMGSYINNGFVSTYNNSICVTTVFVEENPTFTITASKASTIHSLSFKASKV